MSWLKFHIFVIVLVLTFKNSFVNCQDTTDQYDAYEEYEDYEEYGENGVDCSVQDVICNYFNHDVCSGQCHHKHLPSTTMLDLFGPKVTKCCDGHGYTYYEQCDVSTYTILFVS
jgi:hypothetical protein